MNKAGEESSGNCLHGLWEVEIYHTCLGAAKVIKKILTYMEDKLPARAALQLPDSRAPPQSSLFG